MARPTGGWVKLHRRILNSWVSDDPVAAWMLCLLVMWANRSTGRAMLHRSLVTLERGQVATGRVELSRKLRCSPNKIDRLISRMETDSILGSKRGNSGSIITILNYDEYQVFDDADGAADGAANGAASGAATGAATGAHREKREKRKKKSLSAGGGQRKPKGALTPTAMARRALSLAAAVALEQNERANGWDSAEAQRRLGDSWPLFAAANPTWSHWAKAYCRKVASGFDLPFLRDAADVLRAHAQTGAFGPPAADEGPPPPDAPPPGLAGDDGLESTVDLESLESYRIGAHHDA